MLVGKAFEVEAIKRQKNGEDCLKVSFVVFYLQ